MPFLRRRGNMASETDMRRLTTAFAPASDDVPEAPSPPSQPDDEAADPQSRPQSRGSVSSLDRPSTPPVQQQSSKHRRFSVLRFRNASDSQLSLRVKQAAEKPPPVPRPPAIITTAPTMNMEPSSIRKSSSRLGLAAMLRRSTDIPRDDPLSSHRREPMPRKSMGDQGRPSLSVADDAEPQSPRPSTQTTVDSTGTGLNIAPRPSESSRSDVSSTDRVSHSSTPKKSTSSTSFFKLRRNKRPPEPLFPFAHLQQKGGGATPADGSSTASLGVEATPRPVSAQSTGLHKAETDHGPHMNPAIALFNANAPPRSDHSSPTRTTLLRGRSSTLSSIGRDSNDEHLGPPPNSRTSTSIGRKSFGDLLGLTRLRQNSDLSRQGSFTPATPGSTGSKNNSLQLPRDSIVLPERLEDESPAKYIARIEGMVSRGVIAAALSKGTDAFSTAALRSFMRTFSFFGDPMDMALRKLLMEAELPKETQQIDRCLQAFANRYHECNPGIYSSPDQAYFIAFSLLILHTDVYNKNNKRKMQKADYLKNTRGEGIFDEILECFYDNICYTPFIHVEDDLDLNNDRHGSFKSKRKILPAPPGDPAKRAAKEPLDPYTLIIDGNLDALRPNLKSAIPLEDQYCYLGPGQTLNLKDLQKTFFRTGVLQIVSARSRPDAFMSDKPLNNPDDAPGIVDIKITKVGLLWRKEAKKRKTRSPWQEWGAILTGAQLYFFRNTGWVKSLMHQYENHVKAGHDGIPITFKPPLEEFKPDALMSTKGAVALLDMSYKKHKNAFIYVRQGGLDEVLLADDEQELHDWLAKLNYAAAFRTSGVKMRGVAGGTYDGHSRRAFRRLESSDATQLVETPTGLVSIARSRIDHKMAEDIQQARREIMREKIAEADRKIEEAKKALEDQLRNARHLMILAPVQPRTREQLLLAAARMSAQLRWARMEIWKEKCHRDILALDLKEEGELIEDKPTAADTRPSVEERRVSSAPHPSGSVTKRPESKAMSEKLPQSPLVEAHPDFFSDKNDFKVELQDPARPTSPPSTRPTSEVHPPPEVQETPKLDIGSVRHGSVSSITPSPVQPSTGTMQGKQPLEPHDEDETAEVKSNHTHDEVDADERHFLRQAGLLEGRVGRDPSDKSITSTTGEAGEPSSSADKFERSKIRRSLQRTLRESAGHLSHHRSRKGRETGPAASAEDTNRDSTLSRGTGSFVVHGKKASVIQLGTELQVLNNEEQLLARKSQQQSYRQSTDQPAFSPPSEEQEDDFYSVLEAPLEHSVSRERRESAASASTATARSFRELHRKYSSAQAARSVSAGGRLAIPSDADSEVAVSFSDGRRSPLPPIETEEDDDDELEAFTAESAIDEEGDTTMELEQKDEEVEHKLEDGVLEEEPAKEKEAEEAEAAAAHDPDSLPGRPSQAVDA
ncbi:guanine nucleotide exchange factor [Trichoderma citrinoviride]|uniref:Guanine nucleotide exchange factor n=1 Tax=Trichoderma citrinoviride TaxID=58853 RepID=A0A2T4B2K7_9HYPO|nr:guanine nucleotide exchange factor [Trichoderma citrinoviride]PTB63563.1 guanine nucleotide exchange factor [Trichoderma citrinoviride]